MMYAPRPNIHTATIKKREACARDASMTSGRGMGEQNQFAKFIGSK
jgi:hypothetical protein